VIVSCHKLMKVFGEALAFWTMNEIFVLWLNGIAL